MTKRLFTTTTDVSAHNWEVEKRIVVGAVKKHLNRLQTLKMASFEVYLIFSHSFGLDGQEDCHGSQERLCEHLEKGHSLIFTKNHVHDCKHAGICWMTNAKRRRRTNRVARIFGEVAINWESRVGHEPGAGICLWEKHQRFRQILSYAIDRKPDFVDKLEEYEIIYHQKNDQKIFLSKIIPEFTRGKEISQIVFELKNVGVGIIEKDADLFLEVAVIFSGGEIQDGDISDHAREIVNVIRDGRKEIMAEEFANASKQQIKITLFGYNIWQGLYDHLSGIAVNTPLTTDKIADFGSNGQIIFKPGRAGYLPIVLEVIKQEYPMATLDMRDKEDKIFLRDTVIGYLAGKGVMRSANQNLKNNKRPSRYIILDPNKFKVIKNPDNTPIKRKLNLHQQGGESMNKNLDFIRGELKKTINEDGVVIFDVLTKKVEIWKEKSGEDLFIIEVVNKFLANQDVSGIEFDLSLPGGSGIERLELALRLLGSDVQLQDQSCEWVNAKFVAIEEAYKAQMEQAKLTFEGALDIVLQKNSAEQSGEKPKINMMIFYCWLWEALYNHAKELPGGEAAQKNGHNVVVWRKPRGAFRDVVKDIIINEYPATLNGLDGQFVSCWSYFVLNYRDLIYSTTPGKRGSQDSYVIVDPKDFNITPLDNVPSLAGWLGENVEPIEDVVEIVKPVGVIKDKVAAKKSVIEAVEGVDPVLALIQVDKQQIVMLEADIAEQDRLANVKKCELSDLQSKVTQIENYLVILSEKKNFLEEALKSRQDELKKFKGEKSEEGSEVDKSVAS